MKQRKKLFWHLYISLVGLSAFLTLGYGLFSTISFKSFFYKDMARDLADKAVFTREIIKKDFFDNNLEGVRIKLTELGKSTGTRFTMISRDGTVLSDSQANFRQMENHGDRLEIRDAFEKGVPAKSIRFSSTLKENLFYMAVPVRKDGAVVSVLRLSVPIHALKGLMGQISFQIILWSVLMLLIALGISYWLSRKVAIPLEEFREYAEKFAHGNFSERLQVSRHAPVEVKLLSLALNDMGRQLEDRIDTILKQKNELHAILKSMTEGLLTVTMGRKLFHYNHALIELLNLKQTEIYKKRPLHEVFPNEDILELINSILASGKKVEREITLELKNGTRYFNVRGAPLKYPNGEQMGALLVFNDISRVRQLESHRKEFVANVSHELRTPLTSIQGYVETLVDGKVDDPAMQRRFLDIIQKHAQRLNSLIGDLLTLSQIERDAERNEIVLKEQRLRPILKSVEILAEGKCTTKNVSIEVDCAKDLTAEINASLVEQAILNLTENAIKYSPENSLVTISAGENLETGNVEIKVHDEGMGIPKEHLSRLFERFYSVDKARSRELGGTGLGLAIVKHIAIAHHGNVSIESELGKGSTFCITIPRTSLVLPVVSSEIQPQLQG